MTRYYAQRLSAHRLARCYELAPPRMQRYLAEEVAHLCSRLRPGDRVLELGCGYGRVTLALARAGADVVGIDVADDSLALARQLADESGLAHRCRYLQMDALELSFADAGFDLVVCIQNGIAAFRVDGRALVREAWRVLAPGGGLLISTYTDAIWPDRLAWFEVQSQEGLIGPIDRQASADGIIVCSDGFRSGRASAAELAALAAEVGAAAQIAEVDASSLWCEMRKPDVGESSTGGGVVPTF